MQLQVIVGPEEQGCPAGRGGFIPGAGQGPLAGGPLALSEAESLFLRACRLFDEGADGWTSAQQELWAACGIGRIELVLQAFERFMNCLWSCTREAVDFRAPDEDRVGADELSMIVMVAAAQARHFSHLQALAYRMGTREGQSRLRAAAIVLGAALSASGQVLGPCRGTTPAQFRLSPNEEVTHAR